MILPGGRESEPSGNLFLHVEGESRLSHSIFRSLDEVMKVMIPSGLVPSPCLSLGRP